MAGWAGEPLVHCSGGREIIVFVVLPQSPGAWAGPKVHVGNLCSALALKDENENLLAALQAAEDASV